MVDLELIGILILTIPTLCLGCALFAHGLYRLFTDGF
jgi:hypothetical protein